MVALRPLLALPLAAALWWLVTAETPQIAAGPMSVPEAGSNDVVVAVPLSLQPYFIPLENGGLAYDTIRAAFAAGGYRVRPFYVTSRTLTGLIHGDSSGVDCIPMAPDDLDHGWSPTFGLHPLHDFAITRPDLEIGSLAELGAGRVLAYEDARRHLGRAFSAAVAENPGYREIANHRAQVRLLLDGSVDVIIADRLLISWYLRYLEQEGKGHIELAFHNLFEPVALSFICRRAEIAAVYDAGLAEIAASGLLAQIKQRYDAARRADPLPRQPLVGAAAPPAPGHPAAMTTAGTVP